MDNIARNDSYLEQLGIGPAKISSISQVKVTEARKYHKHRWKKDESDSDYAAEEEEEEEKGKDREGGRRRR